MAVHRMIIAQRTDLYVAGGGLRLADDGVFQALQAVIDALDFQLQEVMRVVEASVHGIAQIVDAFTKESRRSSMRRSRCAILRLWQYAPSR